jgi:hypothetical protein
MPTGWIIVVALAAVVLAVGVWAAWRWLAGSWEVIDDDELADKLARRGQAPSAMLWLIGRGWLVGRPRRLTYRRDKRGRFRRIRR